jgi:hypothetical protein
MPLNSRQLSIIRRDGVLSVPPKMKGASHYSYVTPASLPKPDHDHAGSADTKHIGTSGRRD